jgi:hypothetical protein
MGLVQIELRSKWNPNPNPEDVWPSPRCHARSAVFILRWWASGRGSRRPLPLAGAVLLRTHLRARPCTCCCIAATPPIVRLDVFRLWEGLRPLLLWVAAVTAACRHWPPGSAWGAPPWTGSIGERSLSSEHAPKRMDPRWCYVALTP